MTTAVILAGGLGTRLKSVVSDRPKPMALINERPFLEHQIDYWRNQGVDNFIISIGYLGEMITDHFGYSYEDARIDYAKENEPLGTGGGLLLAAGHLRETFLLLNGDTYFDVELAKLREFHQRVGSKWTFSLFRTRDTQRYMGMNVAPNGSVISLAQESVGDEVLANGGVYMVEPDVLAPYAEDKGIQLSLENDILPELITDCVSLNAMEFDGRFIDIGVPEDYRRAAAMLPDLGNRI